MTTGSTAKSSGGLLPMPGSAQQKTANPSTKAAAPRLKLLIRRLPPGLTQAEFDTSLGEDWKVGGGKVDWFQYKEGKVSKDPAKPSRPSRAYLRVTSQPHIDDLSEKVRQTSFQDARNTGHDPAVLGPPTLEFAPYARVPGSRVRKDGRQGTIDQDTEFIAFLESLTNPPPKPPAPTAESTDGGEKKEDKVMTTPLVQFIKDKKANKAKESASPAKSRQGRNESSKETKQEKVQAKKLLSRSDKEAGNAGEKQSKVERASKDAVKAANNASKQAAATASKSSGKSTTPSTVNEKPAASPAPERKRERGNVSAAAKILQRDLGLALASSGRRRGGKSASTADSTPPKEPPTGPSADKAKAPSTPKIQPKEILTSPRQTSSSKSATPAPSTERAASRHPPTNVNNPPTGPAAGTAPKSSKPNKGKAANQTPTATTQAFLKHANPSQGVTEALLESAFSAFGKVTKVEIDKKKGFGYVDFAQPEGLQRAMQSSPVKVAQSQVVVLERKAGSVVAAARGVGGGRKNQPGAAPNAPGNKGGNGGVSGAATGNQGGNTARPPGNRGSRGGRSRNKGGGGGEAPKATGGQAQAGKSAPS